MEPAMQITVETIGAIAVVTAVGDIDSNTAYLVEEQVLPLALPGSKVMLNLAGVPFMSSAGLRVLLAVHRRVTGEAGRVVLVGLSEEIQDTMNATGFLGFFTLADSVDSGLKLMEGPATA